MGHSSLAFIVGAVVVAGVLSCGDEVTEPSPEITGVTVVPSSVDMVAGETADVSAEVSAENGVQGVTLAWSSTNTSVATVEGTGEGTATVTGVSAGSAEITATATASNVDESASGTAGVEVQEPEPATVEELTLETSDGEPLEGPASGEIEVKLAVDPGDEGVSSASLLVDGEVALTRELDDESTSAAAAPTRQQAIEDVVFNFRTDRLEGSTPDDVITPDDVEVDGTVSRGQFENGEHTISAELTTPAGPVRTGENSQIIEFDNDNEFLADLSVTGDQSQSVVSGGVEWFRGDLRVDIEPVIFDPGTSMGSASVGISPGSQTDRASGDVSVEPREADSEPFTVTFPGTNFDGQVENAPGEPDGPGGFGADVTVGTIRDGDGTDISEHFIIQGEHDLFLDYIPPDAGPEAAITAGGSEIQPETGRFPAEMRPRSSSTSSSIARDRTEVVGFGLFVAFWMLRRPPASVGEPHRRAVDSGIRPRLLDA